MKLNRTVIYRIAAVLGAIAGPIMASASWGEVATPQVVGGILIAASGSLLGIYQDRPGARKAEGPQPAQLHPNLTSRRGR